MILEVHRKVDNNVGDYYSNPSRYFNFDNIKSQELMHNSTDLAAQNLIIGGGGLIHKKFQLHIQNLLDKNPQNSVLWGIGHNFGKKHIEKSKNKVIFPDWLERCDVVGIRDFVKEKEELYLPCVSCMHRAFDKKYIAEKKIGYFLHAFKTKLTNTHNKSVFYNNGLDFEKAIEFIGTHDTIITDSYHGAYWAMLLNKQVQVVSWSVKFNYFKSPPLFLDNINQKPLAQKHFVQKDYLEECRDLNKNFYRKVLELFS